MNEENKIILYQDDNEITRVSVRFADEASCQRCLILIHVDTFMSNNKMCFDYGKEETSSKNK